jgi:hypothetical protein
MMKIPSRFWTIAPLYAALIMAHTPAFADKGAVLLDVTNTETPHQITYKEGQFLISQGGTYRLTGQANNRQIWINTQDEKITLIFDNLYLSNDLGSAIYIEEAGDVDVELAANSKNQLEDQNHAEPASGEAKQNAPIYSKADLKITGATNATLTVIGRYKDGIVSKDDLDIRKANLIIESADDGLYGQDSVDIRDSEITINAGDDGIKADNEEREDKGFIYLETSDITINAKDDGIKATRKVDVKSGNIRIEQSYEGIESRNITIHDGTLFVNSEDDALNISDGSSSQEQNRPFPADGDRPERGDRPPREERPPMNGDMPPPPRGDKMGRGPGGHGRATVDGTLAILGGKTHIQAGGDGFDSNGNAMMSGGELYIEGPTSGRDGYIDVDGNFKLTGGRLFAMGSAGMAQTPSDDSTQPVIQINAEKTYSKGAVVSVKDATGNEVYSITMPMDFQSFTLSIPELTLGENYTVTIDNDEITTVKLESVITRFGNSGRGGRGWW